MKDRIKQLRMTLNMTQAQFGEKLGVGRGVIVNVELGRAKAKKLLTGHMCDVFGVDPNWLYTGQGKMFLDTDEHVLEPLCRKYELTEDDRRVIRAYVQLQPEARAAFMTMLDNLAALKGGNE